MTVKQGAKQLIDSLPDSVTLDDVLHAFYMKIKFDRGEREIREGKGVPYVQARRKLAKWLR